MKSCTIIKPCKNLCHFTCSNFPKYAIILFEHSKDCNIFYDCVNFMILYFNEEFCKNCVTVSQINFKMLLIKYVHIKNYPSIKIIMQFLLVVKTCFSENGGLWGFFTFNSWKLFILPKLIIKKQARIYNILNFVLINNIDSIRLTAISIAIFINFLIYTSQQITLDHL